MFNFKKIASVLASVVMLGSTAGMALAANYPAPMVKTGSADGAIVITSGDHAGSQVDFWAAVDLQSSLQGLVTGGAVTAAGAVVGEAYPLFTSGTPLYYNDSLNTVRESVSSTDLPTILADREFSGNKDVDISQSITIGKNPYIVFDKQPTGDEDPVVGLKTYTESGKVTYNLTITVGEINFTSSESEGEDIILFGQKFTVGVDTDEDELYLYKSSHTLELSVGGTNPNPSETVTVEGKDYTVELTAATDDKATIKVTDADGTSDLKEIPEAKSKKVQGLEVAVNLCDESSATSTISAEVTVGAQKVKFKNADDVKIGTDETLIEGTKVYFGSTQNEGPRNITKIVIEVRAPDGQSDAVIPGGAFVDPIFGTFKVDFAGLSIPEDSNARELIEVGYSGNDKATLTMTTHEGDTKTIYWYNNETGGGPVGAALADQDANQIRVLEMEMVNESQYVVVGNEDEGYLFEVTNIVNDSSTTPSDDSITLTDVFSGDPKTVRISSTEGSGTITLGGKDYTVTYMANRNLADDTYYIRLNYPDTTVAANYAIVYPTIETSKGAKVAFYEPKTLNITAWDTEVGGAPGNTGNNLTRLYFPDGDGYQYVTFSELGGLAPANYTLTGSQTGVAAQENFGSITNTTKINISDKSGSTILTYNLSTGSALGSVDSRYDYLKIVLQDTEPDLNAGNPILRPALIIFEEEDDNNDRNALIVQMEGDGTSNDPEGVQDVEFTYNTEDYATGADYKQLETDDDIYKLVDLWGTFVTLDKSTDKQITAKISYPDEQIAAQIYISELAAVVSPDVTFSGGGQILVVKDTEVTSVGGRNLVVVGGSCINSVAAKVLGVSYPTCGSDFTTATNVGTGQYLIKSVVSPYNAEKTAILVAGYEAADTKNAVGKLKEVHATDVGTSEVYPRVAA